VLAAGFPHFGIGFADDGIRDQAHLRMPHQPGIVVDSPDQVLWGSREMLRRGTDQIKVMANGGCVSPADELTSVQFTVAELRAAVDEAAAQGKNVMAHTYTAASMTNCLDAGVRTLEHGNFISSEVAERMARSGTFLVPTIATYELLATGGLARLSRIRDSEDRTGLEGRLRGPLNRAPGRRHTDNRPDRYQATNASTAAMLWGGR
jgi:imidazolonepropionase-like amidohydrolase